MIPINTRDWLVILLAGWAYLGVSRVDPGWPGVIIGVMGAMVAYIFFDLALIWLGKASSAATGRSRLLRRDDLPDLPTKESLAGEFARFGTVIGVILGVGLGVAAGSRIETLYSGSVGFLLGAAGSYIIRNLYEGTTHAVRVLSEGGDRRPGPIQALLGAFRALIPGKGGNK